MNIRDVYDAIQYENDSDYDYDALRKEALDKFKAEGVRLELVEVQRLEACLHLFSQIGKHKVPLNRKAFDKDFLAFPNFPLGKTHEPTLALRMLLMSYQRAAKVADIPSDQAAGTLRTLKNLGYTFTRLKQGRIICTGFSLDEVEKRQDRNKLIDATRRKMYFKTHTPECASCGGRTRLELDHRTPWVRCAAEGWRAEELLITDSDEDVLRKFQVLCRTCNLTKSRRCEKCVETGDIRVPPSIRNLAPSRFPVKQPPSCEGCYFFDCQGDLTTSAEPT